MQSSVDFQGLLRALTDAGVEFIVVGGVGAVLRGAPVTTLGLDIVHNREPVNVDRLLGTLSALGAKYRTHPHLALSEAIFLKDGHIRLLTDLGPLDVLGNVGKGFRYADLVSRSSAMDVGGFSVQVLTLRAIIEIKESVGREKDKAVLPVLRRTFDESGDAS